MGGDPQKLKKSVSITTDPMSGLYPGASWPGDGRSWLCESGTISSDAGIPGCDGKGEDFSANVADFKQYVTGECVYCNHCLPCPVVIDIGQTLRLLDMARQNLTTELRAASALCPSKLRLARSAARAWSDVLLEWT